MDLNEIAIFTSVVQAGSFTAAARTLAMPKSTVSRKVSDLEARLGARLLQRTTRKLSLTDAGRTLFEYGTRILSELQSAETAVTSLEDRPRGLLRVTAGLNPSWLGEIVADYMTRNPEVRVELLCTGRFVDLVEERFDLGIRAGALADSTLVARRLASVAWCLVATPRYLKKRGRPRSPDDLKHHDCLLFGIGAMNVALRLDRGEESAHTAVAARLVVSDFDILHAAALAGLGIGLLPVFRCIDDLRARRLERVLPGWSAPSTPIHAVYPTARHLSAKVKSFVEHVQQRLTTSPWELDPAP